MKKIWIIANREWKVFFQTPSAMVIIPMTLVLCGFYFSSVLEGYLNLAHPTDTTMKVEGLNVMTHLLVPFYQNILQVFILIIPLITMRSFAEEKKLGTYDLLISYPLKPWQILLGKFLGLFFIVSVLLGFTFIYTAVVIWKGDPFLPQVLSIYLGYWLFLCFYTAAGVLASLLTENQIIAAIMTYAAILVATLFQFFAYVLPAPWDLVFVNFLLVAHLETFRQGIILLGDVVAYLGTALILILSAEFLLRRHYTR